MKKNTCLIFDPDTLSQNGVRTLVQSINPNLFVISVNTTQHFHRIQDSISNPDNVICRCDGQLDNSIDMLATIISDCPNSRFLVISSNQSTEYKRVIQKMGVTNLINPGQSSEVMQENFYSFLHADSVQSNKQSSSSKSYFRLTERQKEVMHWILQGLSNKRIAWEMGISEGTIKLHVSSILKTLKVTNRTEAAMKYQQLNGPISDMSLSNTSYAH